MSGSTGPERTGTEAQWAEAGELTSFVAADIAVARLAPGPKAGVKAWLAYHVQAAEVYRSVSKQDKAHQYEAAAYAQVEANHADHIRRTGQRKK
ncbi:AMED_5909 family protein [Actinosynnema sp. CA-248983]